MLDRILMIDDEAALARQVRDTLVRQGVDVVREDDLDLALRRLATLRPPLVILDFDLPGLDGLRALARLREQVPGTPVIVLACDACSDLAVQAMKAGAADVLTRPVPADRLRPLLQRPDTAPGHAAPALAALRGESPAMRRLKATMAQLLAAESRLLDGPPPAVLVRGETGTGKELVARALHEGGPRRGRPFVELNCAALPAQLLESELFGHERGAFTDARERKAGLVETAEGGTLFLDEIGDMEPALQAKLLKLLEERTVRRLGSVKEQKVDVRIVAATHRPLDQLVREGRFRADLYFRLRVVQLELPPLRERGDDVLLLARHFVATHARRYGRPAPRLSAAAERMLARHAWPGNVRELRNLLEQAVLLAPGDTLDEADLALWTETAAGDAAPQVGDITLPALERHALVHALERTRWNVSRAARELGISRDTLRYRIDKHGLAASA